MSWTVEVAADAAASSWTNLSAYIDSASVRFGGQAANGQAGSGYGFNLADDAATFDLPSRRVVRFKIGSNVVARGRIVTQRVGRGTVLGGDARAFGVEVSDGNAHLQGIPVDNWERPAETDVERITALCADFLAGNPRASTDLATTYLSSADPVNLDEQTYFATNPAGVVSDVCGVSGKLFFVTVDDEVFYDAQDSTAYPATLVVTDESPNLVDEFPPINDSGPGERDGSELYTGLSMHYGEATATVTLIDPDAEAAHDYWREVVYSDAKTEAEAQEKLDALLPQRSADEQRYSFAVRLSDDEITQIKYGQTLSYRSAAAGVLDPITIRAARVTFEPFTVGFWLVRIEGAFTKKTAPRLTRGTSPTPTAPSVYQCNPAGKSVFTGTWEDVTGWDGDVTVGATTLSMDASWVGGFPGVKAAKRFVLTTAAFPWRVAYYVSGSHLGVGDGSHNDLAVDGTGSFANFPVASYYSEGGSVADWYGGTLASPAGSTIFVEVENTPLNGKRVRMTVSGSGLSTGWFDAELPDELETITWYTEPSSTSGAGAWAVWTYEVSGIQVTTCGDPVYGQEVAMATLDTSDGVTAAYTTPYPYIYNTLRVLVDGIDWTHLVTQTDPAAGTFTFTTIPASGDTISISYTAG